MMIQIRGNFVGLFKRLAKYRGLLAIFFVLAALFIWYSYSIPKLNADSIYSVRQLRFPTMQRRVVTATEIRDKQLIHQYVDIFNALDLSPASAPRRSNRASERRADGSNYPKNKIQLTWGFIYSMTFIPWLDGKRAIEINGRYFTIQSGSYTELVEFMTANGVIFDYRNY
jgi:hypothetical protein